jgi:fluoride exporter
VANSPYLITMARAPNQVGSFSPVDDTHSGPVDPDVDVAAERSSGSGERPVLVVIALGGVVGAVARYEAGLWWPTRVGTFPWTTFGINVLGCALIGVLLVLVSDVLTRARLLRPLLGTGVLGGFTTFSTYAVDIQRLIATHHAGLALADLVATVLAALAAVTAATRLTRLAVRVARR